MILVTGGAGFIGSNFVLDWMVSEGTPVINLDKLTYAGNLNNLASLKGDHRHIFVQGDIGDRALVGRLLAEHQPRAVVNFAAESHVDRSIHAPGDFIQTNVVGTFNLLEEVRAYWVDLGSSEKGSFRFLHVSTDEVYGSLSAQDAPFTETTPYAPNSPYSASKAASDHLVRAYHHTYGLPTLTTNCSNNYGPYQFPEKLIALMILNATQGRPLPIYGDGKNVRDWLYVGDHCAAIRVVLAKGKAGEVYNIGGWNEKTNLDVVHTVCAILDEYTAHTGQAASGILPLAALHPCMADAAVPQAQGRAQAKGSAGAAAPHASLITYVKDRPGHDRRYAIDARKIERELGWRPQESFETGIRKTVRWYLDNRAWVENVASGQYQNWLTQNYANRAGGTAS